MWMTNVNFGDFREFNTSIKRTEIRKSEFNNTKSNSLGFEKCKNYLIIKSIHFHHPPSFGGGIFRSLLHTSHLFYSFSLIKLHQIHLRIFLIFFLLLLLFFLCHSYISHTWLCCCFSQEIYISRLVGGEWKVNIFLIADIWRDFIELELDRTLFL